MPPSPKDRLAQWVDAGSLTLPPPGGGSTPQRHAALRDWGARDLSMARLIEAHVDALAVLAESRHTPRPGALYGVWASDAPPSQVCCERTDGGWRIEGLKQYCSGATLVDAALVTASYEGQVYLFDVAMDGPQVAPQPSTWASPAFAETATTAVRFDSLFVPTSFQLGPADWYLRRPGFWHGSIGPASCWAGGARSLIDAAASLGRKDAHSRAQVGALLALAWGMDAMLDQAGREIDADPADTAGEARIRGLKVRHLIERACTEVMDRFGRATGPQLLAYDAHIARQHAELALYIRQCHGDRDLETISPPASPATVS